jgi:hypothetical protein
MDESLKKDAQAAAARMEIPKPQLHPFYMGYAAAFADFMSARGRRKMVMAPEAPTAWDDILRR